MATYESTIEWQRSVEESFLDKKYSRAHVWKFDGGAEVPASSSPHSVRLPYSKAENVDPEEALVAAATSCHMLTFLYHAAKEGYVVDSYRDAAQGEVSKNSEGRVAITQITLHPAIGFSGVKVPSDEALAHLHHLAHQDCIIANSIRADVRIEGSWFHALSVGFADGALLGE